MSKPFQVIVADPPWSFKDTLKMSDVARGAAANYDIMLNSDIEKLPIKDFISPDGTILALWVPSSLLQVGLDTMKAWGFAHKQTYVWVKTKKEAIDKPLKSIYNHFKKAGGWSWTINGVLVKKCLDKLSLSNILAFGMGRLFRQTHEICLIGTSSNKIYKQLQNKSQRSVSFGENLKHSAKPDDLQESLETMFPGKNIRRLEIFARRQRKGWFCLGNEAPMTKGEDIFYSLNKLQNLSKKELFPINNVISCYDEGKDEELFQMWGRIPCDQ